MFFGGIENLNYFRYLVPEWPGLSGLFREICVLSSLVLAVVVVDTSISEL